MQIKVPGCPCIYKPWRAAVSMSIHCNMVAVTWFIHMAVFLAVPICLHFCAGAVQLLNTLASTVSGHALDMTWPPPSFILWTRRPRLSIVHTANTWAAGDMHLHCGDMISRKLYFYYQNFFCFFRFCFSVMRSTPLKKWKHKQLMYEVSISKCYQYYKGARSSFYRMRNPQVPFIS